MPQLAGASKEEICALEINLKSCKDNGKGISVSGSIETSGCKCEGEDADASQCLGDQVKNIDYQCECTFAPCAFTEWQDTECQLLDGASCGAPSETDYKLVEKMLKYSKIYINLKIIFIILFLYEIW